MFEFELTQSIWICSCVTQAHTEYRDADCGK